MRLTASMSSWTMVQTLNSGSWVAQACDYGMVLSSSGDKTTHAPARISWQAIRLLSTPQKIVGSCLHGLRDVKTHFFFSCTHARTV